MNKRFPSYLKYKYTKTTLEEGLFMIPGVLSQIIFTKDYFEKNSDLTEFTNKILLKEYKDYLFKNRNALYARVLRDILKEQEEDQLFLINNILRFVYESSLKRKTDQENNVDENFKKENKSVIKSWSDIINPKE